MDNLRRNQGASRMAGPWTFESLPWRMYLGKLRYFPKRGHTLGAEMVQPFLVPAPVESGSISVFSFLLDDTMSRTDSTILAAGGFADGHPHALSPLLQPFVIRMSDTKANGRRFMEGPRLTVRLTDLGRWRFG